MITAILVAAGSSRRMGFDKLEAPLLGQSALLRSFLALAASPQIDHLVLVTSEQRAANLRRALATLPAPPALPWSFVPGGERRQDSVAAGLAACPEGTRFVAVHDAARPLLHREDLAAVLKALPLNDPQPRQGSVLAQAVADSLLRAEATSPTIPEAHWVQEPVARQDLWAAQTPQCFPHAALTQALQHAAAHGLTFTDEVAAARSQQVPIQIVAAKHPNPKLTTPADFRAAQAQLVADAPPQAIRSAERHEGWSSFTVRTLCNIVIYGGIWVLLFGNWWDRSAQRSSFHSVMGIIMAMLMVVSMVLSIVIFIRSRRAQQLAAIARAQNTLPPGAVQQ